MKSVEFTTPKGAVVTVKLETECENLADHKADPVPCWNLVISLKGNIMTSGKRIDHPENGRPCIEFNLGVRNNKIQLAWATIPADKIEAIDAIIAEYREGVARRIQQSIKDEREYDRISGWLTRDMDRPDSSN